MRRWGALLVLLALVPRAGVAAPVVVTSGEHAGFTRLVMQYDGQVPWQVGRTLDGYALRIPQDRPDYDLKKAFAAIGKSRLAALWTDHTTGDLHFGIACACYAMPFEFRPGIVVLDIYDGQPPKGSSFETPLEATAEVPKPAETAQQPDGPVYDWTKLAVGGEGPEPLLNMGRFIPLSSDLTTVESGLEPLRQSLLEEMSRGASQGIVDMAKPKAGAEGQVGGGDPSVQIHLGETPDLQIRQKGEQGHKLTAQGAECISDEQLDIGLWGSPRPVWDQIGPVRQGLTLEFDKPDPEAVTRAIRFMLFIGFGAEARGLMRAFPDDLPDKAIWDSMAHILDGSGAAPAFAGMEECDTAAALWATLADPEARPSEEIGKAAVLRNFSALPPHLRRQLGPILVERFLDAGDMSVATALRDAVLRAPGDPGPEIVMMEAAMNRATGKPGAAESKLESLASAPGPASAEALVQLVEQRAALGQTVEFAQVQALEELLKERRGGEAEGRYKHALVLARAASGDFTKAFAEAGETPDTLPILWEILAQTGPDSALLTFATLAEGDTPPPAAKASASLIADRMLGLGLADQAGQWLDSADKAPDLLRARITLARGKPQEALTLLTQDESQAALLVRAEALKALDDDKAAADIYAAMGKPEDQVAALSRSQAWQDLATSGPDPWKAVVSVVLPSTDTATPDADQGPLARNKALVDESASTRDAITALLNSVKSPAPPTQ